MISLKCPQCKEPIGVGIKGAPHRCPSCRHKFYPSWAQDGDICELCESEIKYMGSIGYESHYICTGCRREWWYD